MLVRQVATLAVLALAGCFDFGALRHDDAGEDLAATVDDLGEARDEGLDGALDLLGRDLGSSCVPVSLGTGCVIEITSSASSACDEIGTSEQVACDSLADGITWMAANLPTSACSFWLLASPQEGAADSTLTQANITIQGGYAPGFTCRYPSGDSSFSRTVILGPDVGGGPIGVGALSFSSATLAIDQVDFDFSTSGTTTAVAFTLGDQHQLSLRDSKITMAALASIAVLAVEPVSPTSMPLPSVTLDGVTIDAPAGNSDTTGLEVGAAASVSLHDVVMHIGSSTANNAMGIAYDTSSPVSLPNAVPTLIVQESEIHTIGRLSVTGLFRSTALSGGTLRARNLVVTAEGNGTTKCFDWNLAANGSLAASFLMTHSNCSSSGTPSTGINLSDGIVDLAGVIIQDPLGSSVTVNRTVVNIDAASILDPAVVNLNGGDGSSNMVVCGPALDASSGRRMTSSSAGACGPMTFAANSDDSCDTDYTIAGLAMPVTTSINGATRPVGAFCDIGAEEL